MLDLMNKEICDYYEPKTKNNKNTICKHFTGNKNNKVQVSRCRHNCSIMECKSLMEEGCTYTRHNGAIKRKR